MKLNNTWEELELTNHACKLLLEIDQLIKLLHLVISVSTLEFRKLQLSLKSEYNTGIQNNQFFLLIQYYHQK